MITNQNILIIVLVLNCLFIHIPVHAESAAGLTVPVLFKYEVDSSSLQAGDAIPIQVGEDVYAGEKLLFKEYSSGVAYVRSFDKAGFLGRGGKIEIRNGYIRDVNGIKHDITLSSDVKGSGRLTPLIYTLATAGIAFSAWDSLSNHKKKASSVLLTSALTLVPLATANMRGKEATTSPNKIVFAHVIN